MAEKLDLDPAIEDIKATQYSYVTNEPINRREGNIGQADLERTHANSIAQSLNILREKQAEQNRVAVNQQARPSSQVKPVASAPANGFGSFMKSRKRG